MSNPIPDLKSIFGHAIELNSPDEREDYLAKACGDNAVLRAEIDELLKALDQAGEFMQSPLNAGGAQPNSTVALQPPMSAGAGTVIAGRYKLLEKIGEGGMGTVWAAQQTEPVRRRVAIKLVKPGMDSRQVLARFEAERQALAVMDHPNIAKVLDGGMTDQGRPYFTMEYVKGVPITDYCDKARLSVKDRLMLMRQVCQAVQHAHQKGIIHRDLKPSNILVCPYDGQPVPKVIDFGLAKAMHQPLTEHTVYTAHGMLMGTPLYMSPEQAEMNNLDIDTRTDIYSLGVILYELLTGSTPMDKERFKHAAWQEMQRLIKEEEPAKPSTRLSGSDSLPTIAAQRSLEPAQLGRAVRGDLDWIVMKSLEKDRTRRYETANDLARDIERYLHDEPVEARSPSARYRFHKFARRNRVALVTGMLVSTALLLGIVASTWQAVRATRAERLAESSRTAEAEQRKVADEERKQAENARENETRLRKQAEDEELVSRQKAYASDMNLAQQSLEFNNLGRARELLNRHRPRSGHRDQRGWEWRYLWQGCQSDALSTLCQKSQAITSLAISDDGHWLAVGEGGMGGLTIWDLQTRQEVRSLAAGDGGVLAVFSPQGPLLAFSVEEDHLLPSRRDSVRIWNAATNESVAELPLGGDCRGLVFSQDGHTLATSTSGDNQIVLWQLPEGRKLASVPAPQHPWNADTTYLAATRDLSVAAHATDNGRFRVVDLNTQTELWRSDATDTVVTALEFSPDEKVLATASGFVDSTIRLWDVASGKEIGSLAAHRGYVHALVFWPDGKKLASSSSDQTICLWDLSDLTQVPPPRTLRGHKREIYRLALLQDNATLVSGCQDGSVCLWDTATNLRQTAHFTMPSTFNSLFRAWRFAPDGKSMLAVDHQHQVVRWHGADFAQMQPLLELGANLRAARVSDDEQLVAAGYGDGMVRIWDLPRQTLLREFMTSTGLAEPWQFLGKGTRLLLKHPQNATFTEWDLTTWRQIRSFAGVESSAHCAGLSFDERWLFSINPNDSARLGNTRNSPLNWRTLDVEQPGDMAVTADGKLIAVASRNGFVRLFDTTTLREVATFRNFLQGVHGVAFSPDDKRLVAGSDGREAIKLWDVEGLQELITLEAKGGQFRLINFSPGGAYLAAQNDRAVVHLWRAPSWAEIEAAEK